MRVHVYPEGTLGVLHGLRVIARFTSKGEPLSEPAREAIGAGEAWHPARPRQGAAWQPQPARPAQRDGRP